MSDNPFTISFGIEPTEYISRYSETSEIIDTFTAEKTSNHAYMITGVRGSGKTVMLASITEKLSEEDDWIVVNTIPDTDILQSIASKLYSIKELRKNFVAANFDFSAFGLGVHIENGNPIYDIGTALECMVGEIAKKGKRLLISIDEIINNDYVKIFAGTFQMLLKQKLPVYLLMTGLYDNIYNLQNEKTLTFLYRAPKIMLEPLSVNSIARSYKNIFNLDTETAQTMGKLTKGYAFAYQVLGYLFWKKYGSNSKDADLNSIIPQYDDYLENYVYEKIWFELSAKEKEIIELIIKNGEMKIADIRSAIDINSSNMSVYRERLKYKGLVDVSHYGYLSLKLPRFAEIIQMRLDY